MNQLASMDSPTMAFAQSEVQAYKQIRGLISGSQVFHLTVAPAAGSTDALESYATAQDAAVAIVTQDGAAADQVDLRLQGISESQTYRVSFRNDPRVLSMSGQALMSQGVTVLLPGDQSSEIVYIGR